MIRKLRARIIIINMALMGIVILAIFTTVCVNSYSNAVNDMERGLNQVVGNRDFDRDHATDDNAPPFDKEDKGSFKQKPNIRGVLNGMKLRSVSTLSYDEEIGLYLSGISVNLFLFS